MKKSFLITIGVIIAVIVLLIGTYITTYNSLISLKEQVDKEYSNISIQLERRADLIPNLVKTVKGYTKQEEKIIAEITEARKAITSANNIKEMSQADAKLTTALNSLNVIVENYPELKSNENFINLQDELAGTENRISVARKNYNDAAEQYNSKIKKIPANIIASISNMEQVDYFTVNKEKTAVPEIDFE